MLRALAASVAPLRRIAMLLMAAALFGITIGARSAAVSAVAGITTHAAATGAAVAPAAPHAGSAPSMTRPGPAVQPAGVTTVIVTPPGSPTPIALPGDPAAIVDAGSGPAWGMFSVPSSPVPAIPGVSIVVLEFDWSSAEPQQGVYDESFFSQMRSVVAAWRAAGIGKFVLNFGMQSAPAWLLAMPDARFVNQDGVAYTADDTANLVFNTGLRGYAADYTNKVFSELGTDWYAVRVGGGHWGELQYPTVRNDSSNTTEACPVQRAGFVCPYYWAFDAGAQLTDPVPGWKPGQPSPNGEAATFLTWYLDSLVTFQQWQLATVRVACPTCPIAVLYPAWGMRDGDFAAAAGDNLDGASSPELNGEVQGGRDHRRQIQALTDPNVVVWGTWADNPGTVSWLAGLAAAKGLPLMGENAGPGATGKASALIGNALQYHMKAAFWIRYGDPGTTTFLGAIPPPSSSGSHGRRSH